MGGLMLHDLINKDMKFHMEFEYYCFKNCYLQILDYYGVFNAKYFLDCTTDWTYRKGKNKDFSFDTGNPYSSFLSPFDHKVKKVVLMEKTKEEIWNENIEAIQNGIPVVVAADVFYLSYTPYYQKKHSYHSLILAGYDKPKNEFFVIDWYPPWYFKGRMSRDELDASRGSLNEGDGILSGKPINYLYTEVERDGFRESTKSLIQAQIQKNLDQYYCGVTSNDLMKGYKAINTMICNVEESFFYTKEEQKLFFEELYGQLFFTPTRKRLFRWYLENALFYCKSFGFVAPIQALDESIIGWKGLLSLLIKCSMNHSEANLELLVKQFNEILQKEKQFYYMLYELNRSLT